MDDHFAQQITVGFLRLGVTVFTRTSVNHFFFLQVTEYVYEEEMEEAYRASLFKSFTKTLEDGFFPVVIVDAIHDKVRLDMLPEQFGNMTLFH